MPDREKVIQALDDWINAPLVFNTEIDPELVRNALSLLKEQEKPNGKCVNECECWDSAYERGKQNALKEQETEWCERCGRVRLKSKWEGR